MKKMITIKPKNLFQEKTISNNNINNNKNMKKINNNTNNPKIKSPNNEKREYKKTQIKNQIIKPSSETIDNLSMNTSHNIDFTSSYKKKLNNTLNQNQLSYNEISERMSYFNKNFSLENSKSSSSINKSKDSFDKKDNNNINTNSSNKKEITTGDEDIKNKNKKKKKKKEKKKDKLLDKKRINQK